MEGEWIVQTNKVFACHFNKFSNFPLCCGSKMGKAYPLISSQVCKSLHEWWPL
jgi:hypothetical protein